MFYNISTKTKKDFTHLIYTYTHNLNPKFINVLLSDQRNNILIYNIDGILQKENNIGFIIYRQSILEHEHRFYIFLIGVHPDFTGYGYGSLLLNEFIDLIKNENKIIKKNKNYSYCKNKKLIVHSTQENILFYQRFGFKKSLNAYDYRMIYSYEEFNKKDIIMDYDL